MLSGCHLGNDSGYENQHLLRMETLSKLNASRFADFYLNQASRDFENPGSLCFKLLNPRDADPGVHQKEKKSVLASIILAKHFICYLTITLRFPYNC